SSRRRHTSSDRDWSSDVCSSDLVVPAVARAHEGHAHKVMGTVSSVDGNNVMVRTADGKTVMVMLDSKTAITRGTTKLDATAVKEIGRASCRERGWDRGAAGTVER